MARIKDYYIDLINLQQENEVKKSKPKRKSKTYKLWNLTITITKTS
jgi:hypothetical protein